MRLKLNNSKKNIAKEFDHDVDCDGAILPIQIKLSKRKSMVMQVRSDTVVVIRAPLKYPLRHIENFVCEKKDWIVEKQKSFMEKPHLSKPKKYIDGDIFQFLGKEYTLQVKQGLKKNISLSDENITLTTTYPSNTEQNKKLLQDWYKDQAKRVFEERMEICNEIVVQNIDVEFTGKIKLRRMKSRWGSCSTNGEITLNTNLICADTLCIDYVILHELCHLREHNHSPRFHALMDIVMPKWKPVKKLLNESTNIYAM